MTGTAVITITIVTERNNFQIICFLKNVDIFFSEGQKNNLFSPHQMGEKIQTRLCFLKTTYASLIT